MVLLALGAPLVVGLFLLLMARLEDLWFPTVPRPVPVPVGLPQGAAPGEPEDVP